MRPLLGYLDALGPQARMILPLTWFTLIVSILVCFIIAALLWVAVQRARTSGGALETRAVPIERGATGINWIGTGLILSALPLLVALVWTMVALASIAGPRQHTTLAIDITPYQWWWQATYPGDAPTERFSTANEIHIPTGTPVLLRLHGGDVIHSFWVPKLAGKTDVIPGQTNLAWIEADRAGHYRGQCSEYCGAQHAGMGFEVVADTPADFAEWRAGQLAVAPQPSTPAQQHGASLVEYRCGLCHQVRGTAARALSAPDLTHLMSRRMLAAGRLVNNPGNLAAWIEDPQDIKPGALMPNQYLSAQQLSDVAAYLEMLQ
jgi:cytochrome c oxidase subunit 2